MKRRNGRRMRCPYCKSLSTVKNGNRKLTPISFDRKTSREVQRYKCKLCQRTFTIRKEKKRRYTESFKIEIARMHVEERMSFRVISKRVRERLGIKLSKTTACRIVNEIAMRSKGDINIKQEYCPKWNGYLTVDDKYFSIRGDKKMILTATDKTGDLLHTEVFIEREQDRIDEFFRFIKERLNYPFKGITTDLDEMLEKSIKTVLGDHIPHQKCLKHAMDNIERIIGLRQKRKAYKKAEALEYERYIIVKSEYKEALEIYDLTKMMLYTSDLRETKKIYTLLIKRYKKSYQNLFAFLKKNLPKLLTHQGHRDIPKTNNIAENTNRQLTRRLKTIESFQSIETASNYLNLYKNYLRFKPYTDCKGANKIKNGKSPLEVCGVEIKTKDWLKNSLYFS